MSITFILLSVVLPGIMSLFGLVSTSIKLVSPKPPDAAKTFVWQIENLAGPKAMPLTQVALKGCWADNQIEKIEVTDRHKKKTALHTLHPDSAPVTVAITFKQTFSSKSNGTTLSYKQGQHRHELQVAGPTCKAPEPIKVKPTAQNVSATTNEDIAATIKLTATDPDSDSLTFAAGQPSHGSLGAISAPSCAKANNITTCTVSAKYTPNADYNGDDSFTYTANDGGLTSAPATVSIKVAPSPIGGLPPDPSTVASIIDNSQFAPLAQTTSFLYTGPNPIQTGVAAGTIEDKRVAVLRGKVLAQDNKPLPGVKVTIHSHSEYGQTLSRADGMFDMAVNGGGNIVVSYEKQGYLPAQRSIDASWRDYEWVPEVIMAKLDSQVTDISSNQSGIQVARGNKVSDEDGARQATVLFSEGTTAEMTLPNGTKQSLQNLHVRATEYTVGPNGPSAMPAPLPPTSGYTYAAELSVDEAIAAGAKDVTFNKPVSFYVDNFLGFPIGGAVPIGYYDRDKAQWVPSENGIVIKIVSITSGKANISVESTGFIIADAHTLSGLGITDEERAKLATLYAPGTSLWRSQMTHFTPWDCNWPYTPPDDVDPPDEPKPETDEKEEEPCKESGSIIECQNRVLGESVGVSGTPLTLNYRSDRVPGRKAATETLIKLTGDTIPDSLRRIELQVQIAGQKFTKSFAPSENLGYVFSWDGKDGYGRTLNGEQNIAVSIGHVYGLVYQEPANFQRSFGAISGVPMSVNRGSKEITLWQNWQESIDNVGTWDAREQGLGGWGINVHHSYDLSKGVLHMGNGDTRKNHAESTDIISTAAGSNDPGYGGDGGPATEAKLDAPADIIVDPSGNLYIADARNNRVRRVSTDGTITLVAGNGQMGPFGDGGPATEAQLCNPSALALDKRGNLYIADTCNNMIRRVGTDGIITTVAGTGEPGFGGDGDLAIKAKMHKPGDIAVDSSGNLYIADTENGLVRRVTTDGIINAYAGGNDGGDSGDGKPATQAAMRAPSGIALGPDGTLYVADYKNHRVRQVSPSGIITEFAGERGLGGYSGDGGPATEAKMNYPFDVSVDPDGTVYIADRYDYRVRRVTTDGIITTYAGNGSGDFNGDGGLVGQATGSPSNVATSPDGSLYITETSQSRVRKVSSLFPEFASGDIFIASEDGNELYIFTDHGRHVKTINSHTGATIYSFIYDSQGHLTVITDGNGNITTIQRNDFGEMAAIISPDGRQTTFDLDDNGYLKTITNPANESTKMTYMANGLLQSFTDARGSTSKMTYDNSGRLLKDENAAGGSWSLSHVGRTTTKTSALNRASIYKIDDLSTGDKQWLNTNPDGTVAETLFKLNGTTESTAADGTTTTTVSGPDARFGVQAPITKTAITKTPSGLTQTKELEQEVALSDPKNIFSLITAKSHTILNGKTTTTTFDAATKRYTATSPVGRQTITTVDSQERPQGVGVSGLAPQIHTYDARGRLASTSQGNGADERKTTRAYNAQGFVSQITNAENQTEHFAYDAAGRVTAKTFADGKVAAWTYDANGNITGITPPDKSKHIFDSTPLNLQKNYTPPSTSGVADPSTKYEYDLDSQLTKITRPGNQVVNYEYDSGGRLSKTTQPDRTITQAYDGTTGQLKNHNTSQGVNLGHTYDGTLPVADSLSGPVTGTVTRSYNNDFNMTGLKVNNDNISLAYDNDGLLAKAGDLTLTRNGQNSLLTGTSLGTVTTTQTYNSFGEPAHAQAKQAGSSIFDATFNRDKLGRITQKTETNSTGTATYAYAYDSAGRLTEVKKDGASQAVYAYDANGNRLSRTDSNGTTNGTYDSQDRMLTYGNNTYAYSENGDLKTKTKAGQTTNYTYDALANLTKATLSNGDTLDYVIDGNNRRIGKKVNGALKQGFLYQNQLNPVAELDGNNNVISRFVYGTRMNVPDYMIKGGNTYRIISDHLGSPRLIINTANGHIEQKLDYDEFGNVLQDTNPGFQPFGFAGGIYDRDTKLTRFGARDYDPETGRWVAKDPIKFAGGDSNLYAYVNGNPISYIDPVGLWRLPDYATFQIDFYVGSISATYTKYGDVYLGLGVSRPYPNPLSGGVSISAGWMHGCNPSREKLNGFLDGWSASAGGYFGIGGSVSANASGKATNVGVGYGGIGVSPGIVNHYRGNVFGGY